MALTTSLITGRVPMPDDSAATTCELTFTLSGLDTQGADVIPPSARVRSVMLVDGAIPAGFRLWRNTSGTRGTHYIVTARWISPDRKRGMEDFERVLGAIQIGSAASYTLADRLNSAVTPATESFWMSISQSQFNSFEQMRDETEGYRDETLALAGAAIGIPQFTTIAAAQAVTVPAPLARTLVDGRIFHRVTDNPHSKSAYQDASGQWFSAADLRADGPIEVWAAWGQSEMRGVTGSPTAISGRRAAESYVLVYSRGNPNVADGWYAVGPEDEGWAFNTSLIAVGAPWYRAAAARAREIGGTVCVVPYAIGGAESGKFVQGGTMWAGLQASWSGAMAAPLPGRGGKSLNDINALDGDGKPRTRAAVMLIWQGSADADYKFGQPDAATSGDDWIIKWRNILNSLQSPSGASVPITSSTSRIVFFEMLYGATGGGAPGVGPATDDRNRDLHKLLKYTSAKRHQIRIVPMDGVNYFTSDPSVVGSPDNLHLNSAAYDESSRRLSWALDTFDFTYGQNDEVIVNANGFTVCRADGTFTCWSTDLSVPSAAVAAGSLFRSSYNVWNIPMVPGYVAASAPNVAACQASILGAWACVHGVTTTTAQTYILAAASQASPVTFRVRAEGFWNKS